MSELIDRRRFLQRGAIAGVASLVPVTAEPSSVDAIANDIGKSKWDLDSPALCVDLDKMEGNIKSMQSRLQGTGVATRPHAKTHKCPAIAKMQIDAGAIGICTAKLSESEVMLDNGIRNVLMTGVNVTAPKIKHAMELRKKYNGFIQAVDNLQNAKDLQDAAKAAGIEADVVVDIDVIKRSGVLPGNPALALAQMVDKSPNLKFRGILAYDGGVQHVKGYQNRKDTAMKNFEPVVMAYEKMKASGLNLEIFSGGGTGTYDIMTAVKGFTDVQVGSYVFMDCQYIMIGGAKNETVFDDFAPSLTIMTTIINSNYPGRLITDSGTKALTLNKPNAMVIGEPTFDYVAGSDEYGTITFTSSNKTYKVGDKLEVIIPHCDPVVNLYDFMYGLRKDEVESILPILARGKSQ
jgi:D-serine deaminase-like pyridoxal phosphate-dependent protein